MNQTLSSFFPRRHIFILAAALVLPGLMSVGPGLMAQINISGQVSSSFVATGGGMSQYSHNGGRPTFGWRADLFFDAQISDNIIFLSNLRMLQDEAIHVDLFTVRFLNLHGPALNADAGVIDVPFLNIGERRFPKNNPFLTLPVGREHHTNLRASDYRLWVADERYTSVGNGVHIMDGGLYDLGFRVFGTFGIVDYAAALTNGTIASSASYSPDGLNENHGFGKTARLAVTPLTGMTFGVSYARGPFLSEGQASYYGVPAPGGDDPYEYYQEIVGIDLDYSYDHFSFYGEAFFSSWNYEDEYGADFEASGFSAELRYVPLTRVMVAARVGGIFFNDVEGMVYPLYYPPEPYAGPWGRDLLRTEIALGYRFNREVLLKAVYHHVGQPDRGPDPADDGVGLQIVASF